MKWMKKPCVCFAYLEWLLVCFACWFAPWKSTSIEIWNTQLKDDDDDDDDDHRLIFKPSPFPSNFHAFFPVNLKL